MKEMSKIKTNHLQKNWSTKYGWWLYISDVSKTFKRQRVSLKLYVVVIQYLLIPKI